MYRSSLALVVFLLIAALAVPVRAVATEKERYQIISIKRDIVEGKDRRTVNGTMMVVGPL
jgi:hypothetical protein